MMPSLRGGPLPAAYPSHAGPNPRTASSNSSAHQPLGSLASILTTTTSRVNSTAAVFGDLTNSATKRRKPVASTSQLASLPTTSNATIATALSPNYADVFQSRHHQHPPPPPQAPTQRALSPEIEYQERIATTRGAPPEGSSNNNSYGDVTLYSDDSMGMEDPSGGAMPPRSACPAPFTSPIKSTAVPPPPPLISILAQQQQQRAGRIANPRQQMLLPSVENASSRAAAAALGVPQPPPVVPQTGQTGTAEPPQKVLTKYFFLKNFAVKPKTPGSMEKQQQRPRRRRGDVSPLPVAPSTMMSSPPAQPVSSRLISLPDASATVAAVATVDDDECGTNAVVNLPDPQGNTHRTIPQLLEVPNVPITVMADTMDHHPVTTARPDPRVRNTAVAALPVSTNGQRYGVPKVGVPVPAVYGSFHTVACSKESLAPPRIVFPTPTAQRDVARSLMDDLDSSQQQSPQRLNFSADESSFSTTSNLGSPTMCGRRALRDEILRTPGPASASTGSRIPSSPNDSVVGRHPGADENSPSSPALPSPTTLGSATPSSCDEDSTGGSPESIASTAEGSEVALDFADDDDCVSAVTDNEILDPLASPKSEVDDGVIEDSNPFALFFACVGTENPSNARFTNAVRTLEADHARQSRELIKVASAELISFAATHESCKSILVAQWTATTSELYLNALHEATLAFFHCGYFVAVGVPALLGLEWHVRLLQKMRRDLFMRSMVRMFLRTAPSRTSNNRPAAAARPRRVKYAVPADDESDDDQEAERLPQAPVSGTSRNPRQEFSTF